MFKGIKLVPRRRPSWVIRSFLLLFILWMARLTGQLPPEIYVQFLMLLILVAGRLAFIGTRSVEIVDGNLLFRYASRLKLFGRPIFLRENLVERSKVTRLSAAFLPGSVSVFQKDLTAKFVRKDRGVPPMSAVNLIGTFPVRISIFGIKFRYTLPQIALEGGNFQTLQELENWIKQIAKATLDSDNSNSFCTGLDAALKTFRQDFAKLERDLPHMRRLQRLKPIGGPIFSVLLLGISLFLYPQPAGDYILLLGIFISMLFLALATQMKLFPYLPTIPRSQWALEIFRAGIFFSALLWIVEPALSALLILFLAGWITLVAIPLSRSPRERFFISTLTIVFLLLAPIRVHVAMRPSPDLKIEHVAWLPKLGMTVDSLALSPDESRVVVTSAALVSADHEFKTSPILPTQLNALHRLISFQLPLRSKERPISFHLQLDHVNLKSRRKSEAWSSGPLDGTRLAATIPNNNSAILSMPINRRTESAGLRPPMQAFTPGKAGTTQIALNLNLGTPEEICYTLPENSVSPDRSAFAVLAADGKTSRTVALLLDSQTLQLREIIQPNLPAEPILPSSMVYVVKWNENNFELSAFKDDLPLPSRALLRLRSFAPSGAHCVTGIQLSGNKTLDLTIWDVTSKKPILEKSLRSSRVNTPKAYWNSDASRLAIIHDYEILMFEVGSEVVRRVPLRSGSNPFNEVIGVWSADGQTLFYIQPSPLTGVVGANFFKIEW